MHYGCQHLRFVATHPVSLTLFKLRITIVTATLESVEALYQHVSQENIDVAGFVQSLPTRFPQLISSVRDFTSSLFESFAPTNGFVSTYETEKAFAKVNYLTLSPVEFYVPPGLNVDIKTYAEAMESVSGICQELVPNVLRPATKWLAGIVSEPDRLSSVRDFYGEAGIKFPDVEKARKLIGGCFKINDMSDRKRFADIAKSQSAYLDAAKITSTLSDQVKSVDTTEVLEMVGVIADIVDKISDYINLGDTRYKVSPKLVKDMADTIHRIAVSVEFLSVYIYQLSVLTKTFVDNDVRMRNIIH